MSISPRQNFLNPPPVPEMPTVLDRAFHGFLKIFGHGFSYGKNSAGTIDFYNLVGSRNADGAIIAPITADIPSTTLFANFHISFPNLSDEIAKSSC